MGSQWVVELAAQRPDLVAHVVAIGPVTDDEHRSVLAQAIALGRDSLGETPRINSFVFGDYLRCGIPWYVTQVRHMVSYAIEDRVAELRMPLLIMRGEHDPVAGQIGRAHVLTPCINAHLVCRLLLEKKEKHMI